VKLADAYCSNHDRQLFCTCGRIMKEPSLKDFTCSQFLLIITCRPEAVCQVNSTDPDCSFLFSFIGTNSLFPIKWSTVQALFHSKLGGFFIVL